MEDIKDTMQAVTRDMGVEEVTRDMKREVVVTRDMEVVVTKDMEAVVVVIRDMEVETVMTRDMDKGMILMEEDRVMEEVGIKGTATVKKDSTECIRTDKDMDTVRIVNSLKCNLMEAQFLNEY